MTILTDTSGNFTTFTIQQPPPTHSVLWITPSPYGVQILLPREVPNRWIRFWHRAFFGFTWESK